MPHTKNEAASSRADFLNGRIQKKPAAEGSGLVAHLVHTLLCAEAVPPSDSGDTVLCIQLLKRWNMKKRKRTQDDLKYCQAHFWTTEGRNIHIPVLLHIAVSMMHLFSHPSPRVPLKSQWNRAHPNIHLEADTEHCKMLANSKWFSSPPQFHWMQNTVIKPPQLHRDSVLLKEPPLSSNTRSVNTCFALLSFKSKITENNQSARESLSTMKHPKFLKPYFSSRWEYSPFPTGQTFN